MDLEERLARVESIERIRFLKARYCDLCDDGYDADALCELFTEDAIWDGENSDITRVWTIFVRFL